MEVRIESVERLPLTGRVKGRTEGTVQLAIEIKVTCRQGEPRPLVGVRRFTLHSEDGHAFMPRMGGRKEPVLPSTYLKKGGSVRGWLTFVVPDTDKKLFLETDLLRSRRRLPVPAPTTSLDLRK